jgi:phage baseplate assembly protein V
MDLAAATRNLKQRISNVLTRARVVGSVMTGGQVFLQVEGLADEVRTKVLNQQQYGFRSVPRAGTAKGIMLAIGGNKSNAIVICADDKDAGQHDLAEGDAMHYNADGTRTILKGVDILQDFTGKHLKTVGNTTWELKEGELLLTVDGTTFSFTSTGLNVVGGDICTDGDVKAGPISLTNHKHGITSGSSAGQTTPSIP